MGVSGYRLTADAYKKYLEQHPETPTEIKEDMQGNIKVNEFLDTCTDTEIHQLFNTSAFNNIVRGYVLKCADTLDYSDEQKRELIGRLYRLFDDMTASEAEAYYLQN